MTVPVETAALFSLNLSRSLTKISAVVYLSLFHSYFLATNTNFPTRTSSSIVKCMKCQATVGIVTSRPMAARFAIGTCSPKLILRKTVNYLKIGIYRYLQAQMSYKPKRYFSGEPKNKKKIKVFNITFLFFYLN